MLFKPHFSLPNIPTKKKELKEVVFFFLMKKKKANKQTQKYENHKIVRIVTKF